MLRCGSQGLSVTVRKFASGNQLSTSLHSVGAALATMMTQLMGIPTYTRDSIPSVLREDVYAILDSLSPHQIISAVDLCLVNRVYLSTYSTTVLHPSVDGVFHNPEQREI